MTPGAPSASSVPASPTFHFRLRSSSCCASPPSTRDVPRLSLEVAGCIHAQQQIPRHTPVEGDSWVGLVPVLLVASHGRKPGTCGQSGVRGTLISPTRWLQPHLPLSGQEAQPLPQGLRDPTAGCPGELSAKAHPRGCSQPPRDGHFIVLEGSFLFSQ